MGAQDNLVVEDGTGVSGANTYITVDDFLTYIDNRGLSYSAGSDHDDIAANLIKATDYIEGKRKRFQGDKTAAANALQFPRTDCYVDGTALESDEIPNILKNAQAQIAYDLDALSIDQAKPAIAASSKGDIIREKVGPIERHYDSTGDKNPNPEFQTAEDLLAPLYKQGHGINLVKS